MINFDHVLDKIGSSGLLQVVVSLLMCYGSTVGGFNALATVFIAYPLDYRCNVSPLDNSSLYPDLNESTILNYTTPYDESSDSYKTCKRYGYDLSTCIPDSLTCVNQSANEIDCDNGYHYDRSLFTETIISDFDLVCDRASLLPFSTSMYYVGMMAGSLLGNPADRFGRKPTYIFSSFFAIACMFGTTFSVNVEMYTAFRALTAAFNYGVTICTFVYIMEIIGPKWRTLASMVYQMFFSFGFMILGGMAYNWRHWQELQFVATIFSIPMLVIAILTPESPRWLFASGRDKEGIKVTTRLGKLNGVKLTEEDWSDAKKSSEEKQEPNEDENEKQYSILDLFRTPRTRITTVKIMFNWFVNSFVYYGISLNAGSLAGDVFVNNTLNGVFEIAAYTFIILVMDRVGRRLLLTFLLLLAGVSLLASVVVNEYAGEDDGLITLGLVFAFVAKFGIAGSFAVIYQFTSELYPTVVRSNGIGTGSLAARIGGIIAPYVITLQDTTTWLPNVIFGVMSVIAGLLSLSFPETNGKPMMETIEQAEVFYKTGRVIDVNQKSAELDDWSSEISGQDNSGFEEDGTVVKSAKL